MSDGDAVRDTAIEFARRQALKIAILEGVAKLERFDQTYEETLTLVQNALMVGNGLGSLGTEVYSTIPQLPQLIAMDGPYSDARKIPTPFTSLNASRLGGLGSGELIIIVGGSGQGKSHILNNFGVMATHYSQGQWIAHVTLELSELDNHLRYGARILNVSMDDIVLNRPGFLEACSRLTVGNRIFVKWFPPGQTNMGHVRSWISALSAELGVGPCMILFDYPDLMVPIGGSKDSLYTDGAKISNDAIVLLKDYNAVGVAASQLGRDQQNSGNARGSTSVSNSIAKLFNCDVMGTINQTEEDQANGVGRIFWDKVRRGRGKFFSYYRINYSHSHIIEDESLANQFQQSTGRRSPTGNDSLPSGMPVAGAPLAPPPQMI